MKVKMMAWAAAASLMLIAAGSLGFGIAAASDSNNESTGGGGADTQRGAVVVPAIVMAAVVKNDGTLDRATTTGVTSARVARGAYEVFFPIDVTSCTYVATIGKVNSSGASPPGFITTVGRAGEPNGIFLETKDPKKNADNRPFHLSVSCPG